MRRPVVKHVVHTYVTVSKATHERRSSTPADLAGLGPVDYEVVREGASPMPAVRETVEVQVDENGRLAEPPPPSPACERFANRRQRRWIQLRDRTCRFPGCPVSAWESDIDHIVAWADGGLSTPENQACLCRGHHHGAKHAEGWSVSGNANGTLTFISPDGRVLTSEPAVIDPEHRWGPSATSQRAPLAGEVKEMRLAAPSPGRPRRGG